MSYVPTRPVKCERCYREGVATSHIGNGDMWYAPPAGWLIRGEWLDLYYAGDPVNSYPPGTVR